MYCGSLLSEKGETIYSFDGYQKNFVPLTHDKEEQLLRKWKVGILSVGSLYLIGSILVVANRIRVKIEDNKGTHTNSYFRGLPRFFPDHRYARQFAMPLGSLTIGFLIYHFLNKEGFYALGIYIMIMAGIWFIDESMFKGFKDEQEIREKDFFGRVISSPPKQPMSKKPKQPTPEYSGVPLKPVTVEEIAEQFREVIDVEKGIPKIPSPSSLPRQAPF